MNKLCVLLTVFFLGTNCWAQEGSDAALAEKNAPPPDAAPPVKPDLAYPDKNKRIQLNFSDELVSGGAANTDVMFMGNRKENSMKKLIRLRENFNSNMEKSKNEFRSR